MKTFAQKQNQPQKAGSSSFARSNTGILGPNHHANPLLHLQRTIGNQAVQRPLRTSGEELETGLNGMASPLFGYDFSRIPIHPPAAAPQMKRATNKSGDKCDQEAERVPKQKLQYRPLPVWTKVLPVPACRLGRRYGKTWREASATISDQDSRCELLD